MVAPTRADGDDDAVEAPSSSYVASSLPLTVAAVVGDTTYQRFGVKGEVEGGQESYKGCGEKRIKLSIILFFF